MIQSVVRELLQVAPKLTDQLAQPQLDEAVRLLDELRGPLSIADIEALIGLLPAEGDTACGLNWSILHAIEASPSWPIWRLLEDPNHEWLSILRLRLRNAGEMHG